MSYLPYVFAVVLIAGAAWAVFRPGYNETNEVAPEAMPDSSVVVLKPEVKEDAKLVADTLKNEARKHRDQADEKELEVEKHREVADHMDKAAKAVHPDMGIIFTD